MKISDEYRVTISDVRRAGYCVAGLRTWAAMHDLDFRNLVKQGISVGELRSIGEHGFIETIENTKVVTDNGK